MLLQSPARGQPLLQNTASTRRAGAKPVDLPEDACGHLKECSPTVGDLHRGTLQNLLGAAPARSRDVADERRLWCAREPHDLELAAGRPPAGGQRLDVRAGTPRAGSSPTATRSWRRARASRGAPHRRPPKRTRVRVPRPSPPAGRGAHLDGRGRAARARAAALRAARRLKSRCASRSGAGSRSRRTRRARVRARRLDGPASDRSTSTASARAQLACSSVIGDDALARERRGGRTRRDRRPSGGDHRRRPRAGPPTRARPVHPATSPDRHVSDGQPLACPSSRLEAVPCLNAKVNMAVGTIST